MYVYIRKLLVKCQTSYEVTTEGLLVKTMAPQPRNDWGDLQSWNHDEKTLFALGQCLLAPGQLAKNQFPESQFHGPTFGQMGLLPYFSKYDAFVTCIITTWNAH